MRVESLASKAFDIYNEQGVWALAKNTKSFAQNYAGQSTPAYILSKREIANVKRNDASLDDVLDTVLETHPGYGMYSLSALQLRDELTGLAKRARDIEPDTVLEIGTANGGTLYTWCQYLDDAAKIVSIDIPGRIFSPGYPGRKMDVFRTFANGQELAFVWENSHLDATYERVRDNILANGESVDFLFIDGDHTYEGVKQDFEMYRRLVADGGIIAFHDIVHHPDDPSVLEQRRKTTNVAKRHLRWGEGHRRCDVATLWEELTEKYRTEEIISHPKQTWGGIGLVYLD